VLYQLHQVADVGSQKQNSQRYMTVLGVLRVTSDDTGTHGQTAAPA
jgi:hypothetical protein